jgi:hypothetical protein
MMPGVSETIAIDARFCGPPGVANGGYAAGLLARGLRGAVEVTLRAPIPLGRALAIARPDAGTRELRDGETLLASAREVALELEVPQPPDFATAEKTAGSCRAMRTHPFPRDFACGPAREPGDGLRLFPGVLEGTRVVAAAWVPHASLADASGCVGAEFVWSALDSPSSFPLLEDPEAQKLEPLVLGRLTAEIAARLVPGERCVLIAWPLALEGRRGSSGTALFRVDGALVARARATWISLAGR